MSSLIKPHGGVLVEAVLHGKRAAEALARRAARLPALVLDAQAMVELELVASGGATPVRGFMGNADYRSELDRQRLATGAALPLPLILRVSTLGTFRNDAARTAAPHADALLVVWCPDRVVTRRSTSSRLRPR